ncbi:hypothetical protein FOZ60_004258 [Perkinsus olseni]|uniref:Uncharacterized protein n=2 Tax=Perkinsus olseni TaxID=32597 RepID=A0A7J6NTF9_PEROL|nr:hypothetical protein FOZ60_004258 [Perkinsus olseni]
MSFCKAPELPLGSPNEKALTRGAPESDNFTFMDCGLIYEVFREAASIILARICTPGGRCNSVSTLCADATPGLTWACCYDEDTRKLHLAYEHRCRLVEYDMARNKTEGPISVGSRPPPRLSRFFITVIDELLFMVVEAADSARVIGFDVLAVPLSVKREGFRLVRSVGSGDADDMSVAGIFAVPDTPRSANIIFKCHSIWHSFRIDNLSFWDMPLGGPKVCRREEDEVIKAQRITGDLVKNAPGLGLLLMKKGDRYVLRRPSGLGEVATFENSGEPLLTHAPVLFDRWAFCCIRHFFCTPDPVTGFLDSPLLNAVTPISFSVQRSRTLDEGLSTPQ